MELFRRITVLHVRKDSPAEKAGIQEGDLINRVDGEGGKVYRLETIRKLIEAPGDHVVCIGRGDELCKEVELHNGSDDQR